MSDLASKGPPQIAPGPAIKGVVSGKNAALKVGADPGKAMRAIDGIWKKVTEASQGGRDPAELRRELIRDYYRGLQRAAFPGTGVKGHKLVDVAYRTFSGTDVVVSWDFMPGPNGPMVLGLCPECHRIAPSSAQKENTTRPLFFENQLARAPGDPEADRKYSYFRTEGLQVELDDYDRLTIREIVRCPEHRRCGWIVRVTDGVASRTSGRLSRSSSDKGGEGGPIRGPLIVSK